MGGMWVEKGLPLDLLSLPPPGSSTDFHARMVPSRPVLVPCTAVFRKSTHSFRRSRPRALKFRAVSEVKAIKAVSVLWQAAGPLGVKGILRLRDLPPAFARLAQ